MDESEKQGSVNEIVLKQKLGFGRGLSIVVGSMIGSGIFLSPTGILRYCGGSVGLSLIIWVVCGLFCLLTALSLSELALTYPASGGVNTYLIECYGQGVAFLQAWSYCLVVLPGKGAALGIALGEYVTSPFYNGCQAPDTIIKCAAVVVILTLALINCVSVKTAARLLVFFTVAKVIVLIIISVSAFVYLGQDSSIAEVNFNNAFDLSDPVYGTVDQIGAKEISLALYQGLWPYAGFANICIVTEEVKKPKKNIPLSITIGVCVVIIVYLLVNCAYFSVLTPSEILQSRSVAASVADRTMTSWSWIAPLGVAISVAGTLNSGLLANGRMMYIAGRRGFLPQILSMVQVDYTTPAAGVGLLAILDVIFIFPSNFDALVQGTQFMEWLFIGMSALGLIFTRYTQKQVQRPYKVPLLIPAVVVLMSAYLVVAPLVLQPDPFVLYATCFTASGLFFYLPLVYFNLKVPGVDHVTSFMQQLFNVAPDHQKQ